MVRYVAHILVYLALSVWIGGLITFGAFVAPALFASGVLPRTVAGSINSMILGGLGMVEVACGVILVGGTFYGVIRVRSWMNIAAFLLSIGMLLTAAYYSNVIFPEMNALRVEIGSFESMPAEKAPLKARFDEGHARYSLLARLVLGSGLLVLVLQTTSLVKYSGRRLHRRHPGHRAHEEEGTETRGDLRREAPRT